LGVEGVSQTKGEMRGGQRRGYLTKICCEKLRRQGGGIFVGCPLKGREEEEEEERVESKILTGKPTRCRVVLGEKLGRWKATIGFTVSSPGALIQR